jgi:hypothetical protein
MISFINIGGIKSLNPSQFFHMDPGEDGGSEAANENNSAIIHLFMYSIFVPDF